MTVVELRQYTLVPGKRDALINLFESELTEPQEACGIRIVGTFRDLDDAEKFVWMRSFPDMERRAKSLADFYGGPVWRRHREAANATMIESENVLLRRPAWEPGGFGIGPDRQGCEDLPGLVQIGIVPFAEPVSDTCLSRLCREVASWVHGSGATIFGCLASEHATNTFPALPVREGENVLVWCAGFPGVPQHRRAGGPCRTRPNHGGLARRRGGGRGNVPRSDSPLTPHRQLGDAVHTYPARSSGGMSSSQSPAKDGSA